LVGLTRADRDVGPALGAGVDEGVARERPFGRNLPTEQVGVEQTGGIGILGTDLGVDDWMRHVASSFDAPPDRHAHEKDEEPTTRSPGGPAALPRVHGTARMRLDFEEVLASTTPPHEQGETTMTLSLGATAPDFEAETTEGPINFHDWIGDSWAVLFSHPKDFTPICTTELGYMAKIQPEFEKRGVKIIGLSVDATSDHERWADDIEETQGARPAYPIIGDAD